MSKEKFNWKSLFVNEINGSSDSEAKLDSDKSTSKRGSTSITKFPNSASTIKNVPLSKNASEINTTILDSIIDMYESGFDSLNLPGYDFYEFFKAIKAVNSNDASVYKMAMTMAQSVDAKVNKDSLLKGSQFYINEIEKVHLQYTSKGNLKRDEILNNQKKEKEKLSTEIANLEAQIIKLQTQISDKKIKLETADNTLIGNVSEIEQKIVANDIAKTKILESITSVVNGIKNNL